MANRDSKGSSKSVVVRQAWVKSGQTKAWFQAAGRVGVRSRRGSEPDKSKTRQNKNTELLGKGTGRLENKE